jgi:glycosyltransferase involved in cell wall biosynthesis
LRWLALPLGCGEKQNKSRFNLVEQTMINVLGIASYRFLPAITGGQKYITLFYKYFSAFVNLYCITVEDISIEKKEGQYEILPFFSKSPLRYINILYYFSLKGIIRERSITHVLLEHPYYGWLGYLLKKFLKVKLIIHSHNIEGLRFRSLGKWWWRILLYYEKKVYRFADMNFFITEEDRLYAIRNFELEEDKCITITYGTELEKPYDAGQKAVAKKAVCEAHGINGNDPLLLFSAALNYIPNQKALDSILLDINPLLLKTGIQYHILICGPGLPEQYRQLSDYKNKNITYAGFVDDINLYFQAADIFINPISEGGGIKTKVVEALAAGCSVVSYKSGALGIPAALAGNKLCITEDKNTNAFTECLLKELSMGATVIPREFFNYFSWKGIANKAATAVS